VSSVERALRLLEHLADNPDGPTHAELARTLDVPRSTLFEILGTLKRLGYVHGADGRYALGPALVALSYRVENHLVGNHVRPTMETVAAQTGETCVYSIEIGATTRSAGVIVPIDHVESTHPLRFVCPLGRPAPLHRTAAGMAILAFSRRGAAAVYDDGSEPDEAAALDAELERVRERGHAVHRGGVFAGALSVAAPLLEPDGTLAGAISVSGPSERMGAPERIWPVLRDALRRQHRPHARSA
jgi:IclR family acetate operon transcriptional repressor